MSEMLHDPRLPSLCTTEMPRGILSNQSKPVIGAGGDAPSFPGTFLRALGVVEHDSWLRVPGTKFQHLIEIMNEIMNL